MEKISDYGKDWETKNHLMTAALEQAAHDKHLLLGAERSTHHELKYPEYVTTHPDTDLRGFGESAAFPNKPHVGNRDKSSAWTCSALRHDPSFNWCNMLTT